MSFLRRPAIVFLFAFLFALIALPCIAQTDDADSTLSKAADAAQPRSDVERPSLAGIWENSERIILFRENDNGDNDDNDGTGKTGTDNTGASKGAFSAQIVLKPFYRYYYDGIYEPHSDTDGMPLAVFDDGLYLRFWSAVPADDGTGVFWRPETNRNEFTIDSVPVQTELKAYYTDDSDVYEIRYWRTKADYAAEKAELETDDKIISVDKYIAIGDTVYTCAVGRRIRIRNPQKLTSLPNGFRISADGKLLVFGKPYATRSTIENLEDEIQKHNSIVYPPHDGRAHFVEPSIYKKLENMSIEDLSLNRQKGRVR